MLKASRIDIAAWTSLAAALLLAGCATAPVPAPQPAVPLSAAFHGAGPAEPEASLASRWWATFGDTTLVALVERALQDNHDIAAALQRVQAARAGVDAQASRWWPAVAMQAEAARSSSGLPPAVKQGQPDTRALRLGVPLSWELDLAGGLRAARDAAAAEARAAADGVAGARLLVASEVARQYYLWRGAEERLALVAALAAAQHETARLVQTRWREGQSSTFDLDRARAEAEAFDALLPPLRTLSGVSRHRLAVLVGADPSRPLVTPDAAFAWPQPRAVAPGQPSELLQRRPDLRAAEARFVAASLRGQEARAQWWPRLFLGAVAGRQDLQLNALDLAPVRYGSVSLALALPLFTAGRIEAGVQAQSARAEEALQAWQHALLVAVQEVEDSLLAQAQERQRAERLQATLAHRQRSLQHAQRLQAEGQVDLLVLLDVQRSVLAAELACSETRLQQQLDAVQLFKALGGGYDTQAAGIEGPAPARPSRTAERSSP